MHFSLLWSAGGTEPEPADWRDLRSVQEGRLHHRLQTGLIYKGGREEDSELHRPPSSPPAGWTSRGALFPTDQCHSAVTGTDTGNPACHNSSETSRCDASVSSIIYLDRLESNLAMSCRFRTAWSSSFSHCLIYCSGNYRTASVRYKFHLIQIRHWQQSF